MNLLTDAFIKTYVDKRPPMTELGEFVYYRTYSRWLDKAKRREFWYETCRRAVEFNVGLHIKHLINNGVPFTNELIEELRKEAEQLYDDMFHLRTFLSGRTLWTGGTPVADKFPLSNFNCSFLILDDFNDFAELFYLLMVGTGVGFRILPEDVAKFHKFRTDVELVLEEYKSVPKYKRQELTTVEYDTDKQIAYITVGDSKEGWVEALREYFNFIVSNTDVKTISINFNNVRPKGEVLKTFGGTASGHESLKTMFEKIDKVIKRGNGTLKTIDVLDIANIIGENVVVGGVRRTSEICLFDINDTEVLKAKENIYYLENGEWKPNMEILHRRISNNSVFFKEKPTREQLHEIIQSIRYTGEPGFINASEAKRRRGDFKGVNPCGEVLLDDRQTCNLTTNNMVSFIEYREDGTPYLNYEKVKRTFRNSARAGLRMTLLNLEIPAWDSQQKKDRLVGVSLTGWKDMVDILGMSKEEESELRQFLKKVVREEVDSYAETLGINKPLLATTVKPEGTLSQLPTVSSGLHHSHSPYYIRRVRINAEDPLAKVAMSLGWSVHPEVGQTWLDANTLVIEFPIKIGVKRTKYDISAIEQLETYKSFMTEYVEHNASITVTVKDDEWDAVEQWVWDNWDYIVGITFISLDNHTYPLAPYEAITEEQYNKMKSEMKPFNHELLKRFEKHKYESDVGESECVGMVCPIR